MSEVRFDCQGLGLVARNEASILVFDTKPVLYRPVLDQIQFCSFDRGCKTCLDTKPVLDQGRFCSLTTGCGRNVFHVWQLLKTIGQNHIRIVWNSPKPMCTNALFCLFLVSFWHIIISHGISCMFAGLWTKNMTWMSKYIYSFIWDLFAHLNSGLDKRGCNCLSMSYSRCWYN